MSMLYSPSLQGGHSLGDWGVRLRFPKGDFHDFSKFSKEMLIYCRQDVALTKRVYLVLVARMQKARFSEMGLEIEHRAWNDIKIQQKNGFAFDIKRAHALYAKLREIEKGL